MRLTKCCSQALFLLILVIHLSHSISFANDQANSTNSKETYCGAINNNLKIKMSFQRQGDRITGSYYYVKHKKPIQLEGTIDADDKFVIKEYSKDNIVGGYFSGSFNNNKMEGIWSDGKKQKSFPFILGKEQVVAETELFAHKYYVIQRSDIEKDGVADDVYVSYMNLDEQTIFIGNKFIYSIALNVDFDSIKITALSQPLGLVLLEWREGPDGNGNYYGLHYKIFKDGEISHALLEGEEDVYDTCDGGVKHEYAISFADNSLKIVDHTIFTPRQSAFTVIKTCSESDKCKKYSASEYTLTRQYSYKLSQFELAKAEEESRATAALFADEDNLCDIQSSLVRQLSSESWKHKSIPLNEARKKYPPVK